MREIKFRAWVTDNWGSEMIQLDLAGLQKFDYECGYALSFSVDAYGGFYAHECYENSVKKYELMQYTGLKDKNGVAIFEGDILQVYDADDYPTGRQEVKWSADGAYWIEGDFGNFDLTTIGGAVENFEYSFEVIGNIHQNKELLKSDK